MTLLHPSPQRTESSLLFPTCPAGLQLAVPTSFQWVWTVHLVVNKGCPSFTSVLHGERVTGLHSSCGPKVHSYLSYEKTKHVSASCWGTDGEVLCLVSEKGFWNTKSDVGVYTYAAGLDFDHFRQSFISSSSLPVEPKTDSLKSNKHVAESRGLRLSASRKYFPSLIHWH